MAEHSEVPIEEISTPPEPPQEENKALEGDGEAETERPPAKMPETAEFVASLKNGQKILDAIKTALKNPGNESLHELWAFFHIPIFLALMRFEAVRETALGGWYSEIAGKQGSTVQHEWMRSLRFIPAENLGNLAETYGISFATFFALWAIDSLYDARHGKEKIGVIPKMGAAWLAGAAFVVAMETGIVPIGTADPKDILAGVISATAFVGVQSLIEMFGKKLDVMMEEIKHRARKEAELSEQENQSNIPETENLAYALATVPEKPITNES